MLTKDAPLTETQIVGLQVMYRWLRAGRFLGMGRRSPVMANGQVPGVKRQYNTAYALLLQEVVGRWGSAL